MGCLGTLTPQTLLSFPQGYRVATNVYIGLFSREENEVEGFEGGGWTHDDLYDDMWLSLLAGMAPANNKKAGEELLNACLGTVAGNNYIAYDLELHRELLPEIVTLAAVTDAVPIDMSDPDMVNFLDGNTKSFDVGTDWAAFKVRGSEEL